MKKNEKDKKDADAFAARVIAEVSALPDSEILMLSSADKVNPKAEAARIRAMLTATATSFGKKRLKVAQEAVAERDRNADRRGGAQILSFPEKQAKLARILEQNPTLTQAARQGQGMNEAELDDYLADLAELGITERDDN